MKSVHEETYQLCGNTENLTSSLKKNDRIRLEVENLTAARNVTMGIESFLIVTEV